MIQHESFLRHQQTSNWRSKRHAAMERAGFACQGCGQGHLQAALQACPRNGDSAAATGTDDLVVLCKVCQQNPEIRKVVATDACRPLPAAEAAAEPAASPAGRSGRRPLAIALVVIAIVIVLPLVALAVS
jgi:hypothetical protein